MIFGQYSFQQYFFGSLDLGICRFKIEKRIVAQDWQIFLQQCMRVSWVRTCQDSWIRKEVIRKNLRFYESAHLRTKNLSLEPLRLPVHYWKAFKRIPKIQQCLSGLVAGDSAICGRLAALILRLRPAGLRFEEFRSPVKRGGLGLRFSNRSGLRPAAIWICGHKPKLRSHSGIGCDFGAGWSCGWRCDPNR